MDRSCRGLGDLVRDSDLDLEPSRPGEGRLDPHERGRLVVLRDPGVEVEDGCIVAERKQINSDGNISRCGCLDRP
jgi:hypothetical protein